MYAGRKVEEAPVEALFDKPLHPYTRGLMRAIPRARCRGRRRRHAAAAAGDSRPGAACSRAPIVGCAFAPRCAFATDRCRSEPPPLVDAGARPHRRLLGSRARAGERAMSTAPVLEVEKLVKHFPIHGGLLQRRVGEVRAVDGVSFAIAQGRDAGAGGRIGLRQVDHRQDRAEADRAHRRPHPAGRRGRHRRSSPARCGRIAGASRRSSRTLTRR